VADFLLAVRAMSRLAHGLLIVIALVLSVAFLRETGSVFLPFFTAAVLSFFAHPLVAMMTRRRFPSGLAIGIVVFGMLLVLAGLGLLLHFAIAGLLENAPRYENRMSELWTEILEKIGLSKHNVEEGLGSEVKKQSTSAVAGAAGGLVGDLLAFVESLVLVIVYLAFLLMGRTSLPAMLDRAFGLEKRRKIMTILRDVESQSLRYIGLRTILCVITGAIAWLILQLYGVEFALLFGVVTFVAQYVPLIGPIASSVLPIGVALIQFDTPEKGIWVAVWLTLWHVFVGYFLEPRVFGKGMHLSQPLVLLGLFFFAWMWGAAGAILAVPLLVVAKSIFDNVRPLRPAGVILGGE
jgi:AI-2 transport protein TqsA